MKKVFAVAFLVLVAALTGFAQTNVNEEKGMKPYDSWHGGDLDSISMTNAGLALHIPLASFPQRGNLDLSFAIYANTKQWKMWINPFTCADPTDPNGCTPHWIPTVRGQQPVGPGPVEAAYVTSSIDWIPQNVCDGISDLNGNVLWNWSASLTAPDGNVHTFGAGDSNPYGCPAPPFRALDASGILQADANTIIFPNGTRFNFPNYPNPTTFTDANGNRISIDANVGTYTDTMGRSIIPPVAAPASTVSGCPAGSATAKAWTIPGLAGGTRTFKFCYSTVSIYTNFGQGAIEYGPTNNTLLTAAVLPDSTMWTFAYDHYGDITRVGFPTGGSISYTYQMGPVTCNVDGSTPLSMIVTSRTVDANDGTGGHTWNYTYTAPGTSTSGTMVVTSPSPEFNDTVHTIGNPFNGTAGCSLYDVQVQYYQGPRTGTPLKTAATQYSAAPYNLSLSLTTINTVPKQTTVTWPNGHSSKVVNTWDTGNTESLFGATVPVVFGSLLQRDEYDFSNNRVRSTVNSYVWQDPTKSAYKTNNLLGLRSASTVCSPIVPPETEDAECGVGSGLKKRARTTYGYDESGLVTSNITTQHVTPINGATRGNLTTASHWLNTSNSYLSSTATFYDTGMAATSTPPANADGLNRTTTYAYSGTFVGAYLTQTNMPDTLMPDQGATAVHHIISGDYDFNTGLLTRFTDENSQNFTYSYDNMLRLTNAVHPDVDQGGNHGQTVFTYPDSNTVTRQRLIAATPSAVWDSYTATFDGVGRPKQTQQVTPSGTVLADTVYDAVGRVSTVSNPYYQGSNHQSDPTYGVTTSLYDALSRATQTTKQDGSITTVSYNDNCTTASDEAGKKRKACVDAFGRLTTVFEDPNGLNYETDYQYDALNNLVRVDQKGSAPGDSSQWRTRLFTYDSLGRLITAYNPESGTICYGVWSGQNCINGYDADGNLLKKTDARGITVTYSYDALNRLLNKTYTDSTPTASYRYDYASFMGQTFAYPIGRQVAAFVAGGAPQFFTSYDPVGRVTKTVQCNPGVTGCKTSTATYDFLGDLKTLGYPAGNFTVTYSYDSAARLYDATDSNAVNYAHLDPSSQNSFWPSGAMKEFVSANFANNKFHADYNKRLQPVEIWAGQSQGAGALFDKQYSYGSAGSNNGNIFTVTNAKDSSRTQTFTYDSLNRLASAQDASHWSNVYTYDAWGNLTKKLYGPIAAGEHLDTSADANNRLLGYSYDAGGNMTTDGINNWTYAFDAENRITTAGSMSYTYDADGRRVKKSSGTNYWYGPGGAVLAETDSAGTWTNYIFFAGQRLARNVNGDIKYYITDHLHSTGMFVDKNGTTVLDDNDFYPWGGVVPNVGFTTSTNTVKFTGQYRDSESQLDYFGARYYANVTGRFMTPDWAAKPTSVPYAEFGDPQSLNLYAYVRNSPILRVDADGHNPIMEAHGGLRGQGPLDDGRNQFADAEINAYLQALNEAAEEQQQRTQQQQPNNITGYDTQDQAAKAALNNSNGASITRNKEYAGLIYKDPNGKYHFTGPVAGTDQGADPHNAKAPRRSRVVGDYHTHADYSVIGSNGRAIRTHDPHRDDFNSDHFSGLDKNGIAHDARGKPEYRGYLGTPSGKFLIYNPTTGQEGILQ